MERMLKNLPWMISPFGSYRKEASMMIEESLKAMESAENWNGIRKKNKRRRGRMKKEEKIKKLHTKLPKICQHAPFSSFFFFFFYLNPHTYIKYLKYYHLFHIYSNTTISKYIYTLQKLAAAPPLTPFWLFQSFNIPWNSFLCFDYVDHSIYARFPLTLTIQHVYHSFAWLFHTSLYNFLYLKFPHAT